MTGERPAYEFRGSSLVDHQRRRPVMDMLIAARTGNAEPEIVPVEYQHFPAVAMEFAAQVLTERGVNAALIVDCQRKIMEQVKE